MPGFDQGEGREGEVSRFSPFQGGCIDRRHGLRVFGDMAYTFELICSDKLALPARRIGQRWGAPRAPCRWLDG